MQNWKRPTIILLLLLTVLLCLYGYSQYRSVKPSTVPNRIGNGDGNDTNSLSKKQVAEIPPAWREIARRMAPTQATGTDWNNVKFISLELPESKIPYWFALNTRPLLEAEKNTNARHANLAVSRDKDGYPSVSIWGYKALRTLVMDVKSHSMRQGAHSDNAGLELDEAFPNEQYTSLSLNFTQSFTKKDSSCIAIWYDLPSIQKIPVEIPFDYAGYQSLSAFRSKTYPIAALPKVHVSPHEFASIILVDVVQKRLVGEIELPPGARDCGPVFALDRNQDVLIAAGYDLTWVLIVDLKIYIGNNAKSLPTQQIDSSQSRKLK